MATNKYLFYQYFFDSSQALLFSMIFIKIDDTDGGLSKKLILRAPDFRGTSPYKRGMVVLPVSVELKKKLKSLNESLKQAFPLQSLDESKVRKRLEEAGTFHRIEKWNGEEIKNWLQERYLVGVDGSVNSTKGSQIRTLSVFQALAKATNGKEKWAADVYTPLIKREEEEEENAAREARKRGNLLSRLEMQVTMEAMKEWAPRVVMLDGSLLHFYISDAKRWEQLAQMAEIKNTLLVGVSEENRNPGLGSCIFS